MSTTPPEHGDPRETPRDTGPIDAEIIDAKAQPASSYDAPDPDDMDEAGERASGRNLVMPFGILLGALVFIALLVFFLNRQDGEPVEGAGRAKSTEVAQADIQRADDQSTTPRGTAANAAPAATAGGSPLDQVFANADSAPAASATEATARGLIERAAARTAQASGAAAGAAANTSTAVPAGNASARLAPTPGGQPATPATTSANLASAVTAAAPAATAPTQPTPTLVERIVSPVLPGNPVAAIKEDIKSDVLAETQARLDARLAQTDQQLESLRQSVDQQQQQSEARITSLNTELQTLRQQEVSRTRQSTLLLALSALSDEIEAGKPFARELDTVEQVAPNSRSLILLRRYAETGLPTMVTLQADYQAAARRALSGARRVNAEGGMSRLFANMAGLVSVRPIGDIEGDTPSAIIARGEARLVEGDLAACLNELKALEGPPREAFARWIELATARHEARRRINALEQQTATRAG